MSDEDRPWEEFGPEDIDQAPGPPITYAEQVTAIEANRRTYTAGEGATAVVWVADGHGVAVRVRNGCLELTDGVPAHRRVRTLTRAEVGAKVRRLLVLGAGMVTTEAMAWCHLQGLPLVVARTGQEPTMLGAPALFDHGGLRQAQAVTSAVPFITVGVLRSLIDRRLSDQARIAADLFDRPDVSDAVHLLRRALIGAESVNEIMTVEARAAERYWSCWEGLRLRFVKADRERVPEHWVVYQGRRSPLLAGKAGNRHAASPLNAILNFGYKLTETEACTSLVSVGLDPAIGWGHANRLGRPAAALDLMEAARGVVEEVAWHLANERTFAKSDFREDYTGQVWLRHPFSHLLTEMLMSTLAVRLAPVTEELAQQVVSLAPAATQALSVPTPLTGGKRKVARRSTGTARHPVPLSSGKAGRLPRLWSCPECGTEVENPRHVLCPECQAKAGHTPAVRQTRGRAIASRKAILRASSEGLGFAADKDWYRAHILPGLASHKLSEIVACGVSKGYASYIRSGKYVPNVALWSALARLAGVELPKDMGTPEPNEAAV